MEQAMPDDLWRDFPKTATEFEARFATEDDCRAYWIEARWGGRPAFADGQIAADAQVVTDGLASFNSESLGERPHQAVILSKQQCVSAWGQGRRSAS